MRNYFARVKNLPQWRAWKNKVNHLISESKSVHYKTLLEKNKNNPKAFWKIFHELIPKKTRNSISLLSQDSIVTDPKSITEIFNEYFSSIADDLSKNNKNDTHPDLSRLQDYINDKIPPDILFHIPPINHQFVLEQLQNLDVSKGSGLDGISPKLLKLSSTFISRSILTIFNKSITSCKFPSIWKEARIICLHNGGSATDKSNYRPISLLPIISKILERHVFVSILSFLNTHNLLSDNQSGFRKKHNGETALLKVTQDWYDSKQQITSRSCGFRFL